MFSVSGSLSSLNISMLRFVDDLRLEAGEERAIVCVSAYTKSQNMHDKVRR